MKETKKLSALEKLKIEKLRLKAEEQVYIQSLDDNFSYLQDNLAALLFDAGVTAVKKKASPYISRFIGGSDNRLLSGNQKEELQGKDSILNLLLDQIINIAPFFMKGGFKSLLVSFLLKQAKNFLFKKK